VVKHVSDCPSCRASLAIITKFRTIAAQDCIQIDTERMSISVLARVQAPTATPLPKRALRRRIPLFLVTRTREKRSRRWETGLRTAAAVLVLLLGMSVIEENNKTKTRAVSDSRMRSLSISLDTGVARPLSVGDTGLVKILADQDLDTIADWLLSIDASVSTGA